MLAKTLMAKAVASSSPSSWWIFRAEGLGFRVYMVSIANLNRAEGGGGIQDLPQRYEIYAQIFSIFRIMASLD